MKKVLPRAVTPLVTPPNFPKDLRVPGVEDPRTAGEEPLDSRDGSPASAGRRLSTAVGQRTLGVAPTTTAGSRWDPPRTSRLASRPGPPGIIGSVNILDPEKRDWAQKEAMGLNLEDAVECVLEVLEYELERPHSKGGTSVDSLCDDELRHLHAEREVLAREGEFGPKEEDGASAIEDLEALHQAIEEL